jgi:hypothetical protein
MEISSRREGYFLYLSSWNIQFSCRVGKRAWGRVLSIYSTRLMGEMSLTLVVDLWTKQLDISWNMSIWIHYLASPTWCSIFPHSILWIEVFSFSRVGWIQVLDLGRVLSSYSWRVSHDWSVVDVSLTCRWPLDNSWNMSIWILTSPSYL